MNRTQRRLQSRAARQAAVRRVRIPVTGLRDEFGMSMHVNLRLLAYAPSADAFESLAQVFNVVQVAIKDDARHATEARIITGGAAALVQIESRVCRGVIPADHEIAQVRVGVNAIDALMGKLDLSRLYGAMRELERM